MKSKKCYIKKGKKNKQRGDLTLNKEVATALTQMILNGQSIFSKKAEKNGYITLPNGTKIPYKTVNSWVQRKNVIPETGKVLRDLLEQSREEYCRRKREERQEEMLDQAENELNEILNSSFYSPLKDKNNEVVRDKNGNIVYEIDSKIMRAHFNAAKFIWERLGERENNKNSNEFEMDI